MPDLYYYCITYINAFSLCSGSHQAIITNTTVEVVVPRSAVPAIYGEDGGCLKQIREVHLVFRNFHNNYTSAGKKFAR